MDKLVLLGAAGGLLPDILRIIAAGRQGTMPGFLKTGMFWMSLVLLAGIGALAVWNFGAGSPKEAIAIGFGAPELISRLGAAAAGQGDRGTEGAKVSLLDWWRY
jgi:hypothetical protein